MIKEHDFFCKLKCYKLLNSMDLKILNDVAPYDYVISQHIQSSICLISNDTISNKLALKHSFTNSVHKSMSIYG